MYQIRWRRYFGQNIQPIQSGRGLGEERTAGRTRLAVRIEAPLRRRGEHTVECVAQQSVELRAGKGSFRVPELAIAFHFLYGLLISTR